MLNLHEAYLNVYTNEDSGDTLDEVVGLGGEVSPATGKFTGKGRSIGRSTGGVFNRSTAISGGSKGANRFPRGGATAMGTRAETGMKKTPMDKATAKRAEVEKAGNFKRANRLSRGISAMEKPVTQYYRGYSTGKAEGRKEMREELDIYDVVLEYLLDEGYADSESDAIIIMSSMSEEWIESVIEDNEDL